MSWLNLILEDILLEAKTPEEIKQMLEYQFVQGKGIPQEILDSIFNMDPTKKKSYTKWGLTMYENEPEVVSDAIKNGSLEKIFKYFHEKDGLNLAQIKSIKDAESYVPKEEHEILKKVGDGGPQDDFDIVFRSNEWIIAVPHTYEADVKLGQGCRWCTAGAFGDGPRYWKTYSAYGPIWVNFDLRKPQKGIDGNGYPFTRYQFLFEYTTKGEMKDYYDNTIYDIIETTDMPEDVVEFYSNQNPKYKNILEDNSISWDVYMEARDEEFRCVLYYEGNYLSVGPRMADNEDELTMDFNPEHISYYLYDEDDNTDAIDYWDYNPNDCIVQTFDGFPVVILKRCNGYIVAATCDKKRRTYEFNIHDEVIYYGDMGSFMYFIDDNDNIFVYSTGGLCLEGELYMRNGSEDFVAAKIDSSNIEGYESSMWIEGVDTRGLHALFYLDINNNKIETIIAGDYPINDQYFELQFDGDNAYIQGKLSKHWLGESDENEESFDILEAIPNKNIYFVSLGENEYGEILYNIYDGDKKSLLLKEPFNNYSKVYNAPNRYKLSYVKGETWNHIIYDVNLNKVLTPMSEDVESVEGIFWCENPEGMEEGVYFYKENNGSVEYTGVKCRYANARLFGDYFVITTFDGNVHVADIATREITLPDNIDAYGEILHNGTNPKCPCIMARDRSTKKISLINFMTNQVIATDVAAKKCEILVNNDYNFIISLAFADGSYNLVSNNELLFTQNITEFPLLKKEVGYRSHIFCCINKRKYYFLNIDDMSTTPHNGISTNVCHVRGVNAEGNYGIAVNDNEQVFDFVYNPAEDRVLSCDNNNNPELMQIANSIIHQQAVQIAENFKRIYNKIKDFENIN